MFRIPITTRLLVAFTLVIVISSAAYFQSGSLFTAQISTGLCTNGYAITEYSLAPGSKPIGITVGSDGNLWFAENGTSKIGRMTPLGVIDEFASGGQPWDITAGSDGNLWFTQPGASLIGRITPQGAVGHFSVTGATGPYRIGAGPDGNLWFGVNTSRIFRITTDGVIDSFNPGAIAAWDVVGGPDGNIWYTSQSQKVGRITPSGSHIIYSTVAGSFGPYGIAKGPDGALWFGLSNKIGRITTGGEISYFTSGYAWNLTAGADGNIWYVEQDGKISRMTPTGTITQFPVPTPGSQPYDIIRGPDDNIWFTELGGDKIGKIAPCSAQSSSSSSNSGQPGSSSSLSSSSVVGFCGAVCGDRIIMEPEECDNGPRNSNTDPNACRMSCRKAYCGDRVIDLGEFCDDGNTTNGDGCSSNCQVQSSSSSASSTSSSISSTSSSAVSSSAAPRCGDGMRNRAAEQCDDGNTRSNDGCSSQCITEQGWQCLPPGGSSSSGSAQSGSSSSTSSQQPAASSSSSSQAATSSSSSTSSSSAPPPVACTDSDGGYDISKKGTLSTGETDVCESSTHLREFNCAPRENNVVIRCPAGTGAGCVDGRCLNPGGAEMQYMSNPGIVTMRYVGECRYRNGGFSTMDGSYTLMNSCQGSANIARAICIGVQGNTYIAQSYESCPANTVCKYSGAFDCFPQ